MISLQTKHPRFSIHYQYYLLQHIRTQLSRVRTIICGWLLKEQTNSELLWRAVLSDGKNAGWGFFRLVVYSQICPVPAKWPSASHFLSFVSANILPVKMWGWNSLFFPYDLLGADEQHWWKVYKRQVVLNIWLHLASVNCDSWYRYWPASGFIGPIDVII